MGSIFRDKVLLFFPFSHQKNILFTKQRALLLAVSVLVISGCVSAGYLHTATHHKTCTAGDPDNTHHRNYNQAVPYLCIIAPFCLMFIFTVLISVKLRRIQNMRSNTFLADGSQKMASPRQGTDVIRKRINAQAQAENALTTMLLVATLVFLLLSFPLFLVIIDKVPGISFNIESLAEHSRFHLFRQVAKQLEIFSHALYFFVYFLSARKFRVELLKLCRRPGRGGRQTFASQSEFENTTVMLTDV